MINLTCPVCKSDSYINPNIKFHTSPCFHRLCEDCMHKIYSQGPAPCPECGVVLRRINFIISAFENTEIEKEVRIRKILTKNFNRGQSDFQSMEEYNIYLETFENLVFEILEARKENRIKNIVAEIKSTTSILCSPLNQGEPRPERIKAKQEMREDREADRVEEKKTHFGPGFDIEIPKEILQTNEVGGVTKEFIYSYLLNSLYE